MNGWRAPCRHIGSRSAPQFLARLHIKGTKERTLLHVGLDDDLSLVDDRRAAKLPLRGRHHEEARVEHAKVHFPELLALHVERKEPFGPEHRHDVRAISGQRRIGVRGLRVPLYLRHTLVHLRFEEHLAGRWRPCRSRSHVCTVSSVTDAISPYKPSRMLWSPLPDFAVVTHSWLPQMIGLA